MSTFVLDIPDELAARLAPHRDHLPQLLAMAVDLLPGGGPTHAALAARSYPVYREMIDFLVSGPSREQIIRFKMSSSSQRRLSELLDRNREGNISEEQKAELEAFSQVNHILVLMKARAHATGMVG